MMTRTTRRLSISLLAMALFAPAVRSQAPKETPAIKPIESLWLTSPQFMSGPPAGTPLARSLKDWRQVFDAIMLVKLPPTFAPGDDFTARANALIKGKAHLK
jgi:hypothetical protein